MLPVPEQHFPPLAGMCHVMVGAMGGVEMMILLGRVTVVVVMPVPGLCWNGSGQKNSSRCK
jgi:hypothetical protein